MMNLSKAIYFFIFVLLASGLSAKEVRYMSRSPYALLMGDAFTARADDDYTLFYNPAALGRNSGLELRLINPDLGITNALDEQDRFKDFPKKDPAAISDRILGLPIYLHAGAHPGLKFGPFGLNLFASTTSSIILRNAIHPTLDIDYRYDRGFLFGYAYTVGKGFMGGIAEKKNSGQGVRTSIGLAVKNVNRDSLVGSFDLFGTTLLEKINSGESDDITQIRDSLGYSKGNGWGVDLGVESSLHMPFSELSFGLSVMDVGGTKFKRYSGDEKIPEQEMAINTGVTWRQDFTILDYSLSFDMHPLNQHTGVARMIHVGLECGIPLIRAMAGFSQGYISYGLAFKFWPIKILAGFYSVELGRDYREEKGSRALIYLSLFDFSFDA